MTEFKFSCPSCRQNFKVDTSVCGRKIECPSCHAKIIAPEAPKNPDEVPAATLDTPAPARTAAPPAPAPSAPPVPRKSAEPAPRPQIPILTAPIKQEIVAAVKRLLNDKARWMPRINEQGEHMYAAKDENGKLVPVSVESPEASRFSLLGAFLREFQQRNVMRTAAGRKRFLDKAIPDAISAVLKQETGKLPEDLNKVSLTHEQTLKAIALLESKFDDEADMMAAAMEQVSRMGKTRLSDLVMKIEGEAIITNEEIATALFHEVEEIKSRLAALEARAGMEPAKKADGAAAGAGEKR